MKKDKLAPYLAHIRKMDEVGSEFLFPQFPTGLTWFNTHPLTLDSLNDYIVVLNFWTSCSIHCIHTFQHLKKLEDKYRNHPVLFLGIHSAKFTSEKDDEQLKKAIERYNIHYPILNDHELKLWRELGICAWPTFMVIGPKGQILFSVSGEGKTAELDLVIEAALDYYTLHSSFFIKRSVPPALSSSILKFPGKITTSEEHNLLFIADSGHHRIVVCTFDGHIVNIIGNGEYGFIDGNFHQTQFNNPQGIIYHDGKLYIADTGNHALRCAELDKGIVLTLAGTGQQSSDYKGGKTGIKQSLCSPWDLISDGQRVFIAMAGSHQIWVYDDVSQVTANFSGTGQELHLNSNSAFSAAWAQPSGLSLSNEYLFIADSESSSIRAISLKTGQTTTLTGGDPENPYDLFAYGDQNGLGSIARLQHPLAILWMEPSNELIIADTYNHRLKRLDTTTGIVSHWIGTGRAGKSDGNPLVTEFSEPSGLAVSLKNNLLFVADTNNHSIRRVDLTNSTTSTLLIKEPS